MNKELQDLAWAALPKEFREEVKKYYRTLHEQYKEYDGLHFETAIAKVQERIVTLEYFFGGHNLTSDASEEPKPVEPKFKRCDKVITPSGEVCIIEDTHFENGIWLYLVGKPAQWITESDLEPYTEQEENVKMKPIESKVSVYLATKEEDEEFRMLLHENGFIWNSKRSLISQSNWASDPKDYQIHFVYPDKTVTYSGEQTEDTLTFTEFKKQYFGEDVNLSQKTANCDKEFDTILKGGFRDHNRLQIAAMAMQGLMCNPYGFTLDGEDQDKTPESIAEMAFLCADALIARAEKGGNE